MVQVVKAHTEASAEPESLPTPSQALDTLASFPFLQKAKLFPASRSVHTSLSKLPLILQVITEMSGDCPDAALPLPPNYTPAWLPFITPCDRSIQV